MAELVEAAARTSASELASDALEQLSEITQASGTNWFQKASGDRPDRAVLAVIDGDKVIERTVAARAVWAWVGDQLRNSSPQSPRRRYPTD